MKLFYLFVLFLLCSATPQIAVANSVSIESTEYIDAWSPRVPKKVKKNKKKRTRRIKKLRNNGFGEVSWISIGVIFLMGIFMMAFPNYLILSIIGAIIISIGILCLMIDFNTFDMPDSKAVISVAFSLFNGIIAVIMLITGLLALHPIIWITGLILLLSVAVTILIAVLSAA
jgi:hypothetical protein